MTGVERTRAVFACGEADRPPVVPILHTGLAPIFDIRLGDYFTRAETMASVMIRGCRDFGFDGVQLSQGVTGEAEALGARVEQPPDGAPLLREHLLADLDRLPGLTAVDVTRQGRMPLFFEAVERVVREIGHEDFVLVTLRGPLLAASQLRGVEQILMDLVDVPEQTDALLEFAGDLTWRLGRWLRASGAHGLLIGEATCSPNFISPDLYRARVLPLHRRLVKRLKDAGWEAVGMHICGNTVPIFDDIISTGVDFLDVDYQVQAAEAVQRAEGRVAMRGNLDPSAVFRFGAPDRVRAETGEVLRGARGARWIMSSGCDIPPGTPAENIAAFVETVAGSSG